MSNRRIVPFVVAFGLLVLLVAPLSLAATADQGGAKGDPGKVPGLAIVKFANPSISEYGGGTPGYLKTKVDPGQHLDVNAPAVQAYDNFLANSHANFVGRTKRSFRWATTFTNFRSTISPDSSPLPF